jgi:hypothetical protein
MVATGRLRGITMSTIQKSTQVSQTEVMTQEALLANMKSEVQSLASIGWTKIKLVGSMDLMMLYDLGEIVSMLTENKNLDEKSKSLGVVQLATYWSMGHQKYTPAMLYNLKTVPETFDRQFFSQQIEKPMANGELLTWSHFVELQKLEDAEEITDMLDHIRKECLSSRDLKMQIESEGSAKVKRFGGRKPKMPTSPTAALRKFKTTLQKSDNYIQAMLEPLKTTYMQLSSFDVSMLKNADDALSQMDKLMWDMQEAEQHIKAFKQKVQSSLNAAPAAVAAKDKVGAPITIETTAVVVAEPKRGRGRPRKAAE